MAIYKIKDFDPNYRDHFDGNDVKDFDLYSGKDKVGSIDDVLVDDNGKFRYLVVNTGAWIFGKKVMLPIGLARIDYNERRAYSNGLTKEQVENLPEFNSEMLRDYDYDYEERVRGVYRPGLTGANPMPVENSGNLESSASLERGRGSQPMGTAQPAAPFTRETYDYDREPNLYGMRDQDHGQLRLYEERLIANKQRAKTGEVSVGKHVETETARASVPIEKERVVIERNPAVGDARVAPGDVDFREGEVARMEVYEETPDIHKEAFVREQVNVRKEVDRDVIDAEEQIRREELNVDTKGRPTVEKRPDRRI